ncbi:MAG: MFS transporter [Pseudomonadales bacterium]
MLERNLLVLITCQCISVSATVLVVTIGGIVGLSLSPDPALATLPMSLMIVGTAAATVPAAMIMRRFGRRIGFSTAALAAAVAALLGAAALWLHSFALFCVFTLLIGAHTAYTQQYRFAAAESVEPLRSGRAISLVLVGSIGGALVGPELATRVADWAVGPEYLGSLLAVSVLFLCSGMLLALCLEEPQRHIGPSDNTDRRPLGVVVRQPLFLVAVLGGVVGQGVMTFVMTATPISMHVMDGFSMAETAGVIRTHVLAMYVPSLLSAALIGWLGVPRLMALGLIAFAVTLGVALNGHALMHYWWALLLLGVGWNFLFVGGTSLLVQCYLPAERFTAQAINDFSVFGVAALGSLLAGSVIHVAGWHGVLWGSMPPLVLMAIALGWLLMRGRRAALASGG